MLLYSRFPKAFPAYVLSIWVGIHAACPGIALWESWKVKIGKLDFQDLKRGHILLDHRKFFIAYS
jgi:hypothetical protein